ncbi:hypothetical protein ACHAXR_009637 [Thalassiosira sp. AJA248-18]
MLSRMIRGAPCRRRCQFPSSWSPLGEERLHASPFHNSRPLCSTKRRDDEDDAKARSMPSNKTPTISLCQVNNHPDFRLSQARAKFNSSTINSKQGDDKNKGTSIQILENPIRSSDGTSSGALAADRLRMARRKAMENAVKSFPVEQPERINAFSQLAQEPPVAKEHGGSIQILENPIRSSDGTSSGALAADRLRMARRKAMENAVKSFPVEQPERINAFSQLAQEPPVAKEHGGSIQILENPIRSSDGTSSGALAADRLRMARRKAVENMIKTNTISAPKSQTKSYAKGRKKRRYNNIVKENNLAISVMENPVRSNDGTSSGALTADRLRMARRRALESMKKPGMD